MCDVCDVCVCVCFSCFFVAFFCSFGSLPTEHQQVSSDSGLLVLELVLRLGKIQIPERLCELGSACC